MLTTKEAKMNELSDRHLAYFADYPGSIKEQELLQLVMRPLAAFKGEKKWQP
jgi:hypothetical protein